MANEYMGENLGGVSAGLQGIPFLNLVFGPMVQAMEADARNNRLRDMMQAYEDLRMPQFDKAGWNPTISDLEKYQNPIMAMAERIQIDPKMREKQMQSLDQLRDLSEGYGAAQNEAGRRQAIYEANQMAKARSDAAAMNASMRGVGGSGLDIALQAQGSQDAANRAMMGGLEAAKQGAQQRYQGNMAYQQGMSNVRAQDTDLAGRNAAIGNQFELYNTGLKNQNSMANTQLGNQNIMNRQNLTNQARQYNLGRGDDMQKSLYNAALQKLAGKYGVTKDMVGLSERQSERDTEKAKDYRQQWNSLISMAAGGGNADVAGMAGGTGNMGGSMGFMGNGSGIYGGNIPNFGAMSNDDWNKWVTHGYGG